MASMARPGGALRRLIVIGAVCACLGIGGFVTHRYRKQSTAQEALAVGKDAYAAGRYTEAALNLNKYLAYDSSSTEILLAYADAQVRRRPQARGQFQQAVGALERILRRQPGHRIAAERLYDLYQAANMLLDAERVARSWLHAPGNDPASQQEARKRLIAVLTAERKLADAETEVKNWLAESPNSVEALSAQADVHVAARRVPEAIAALQTCLATEPDNVQTSTRLAVLLIEQSKDRESAEKLLNELVERNPSSAPARVARGQMLTYLMLSSAPSAVDYRSRALADFEAARNAAGNDLDLHLQLAGWFARFGESEKAKSVLEQAEKLVPSRIEPYLAHAQLLLETADQEAAAVLAERISAAPLGESRFDVLPVATELYALGNKPEAARRNVSELQKSNLAPETLLYLNARISLAEGKTREAIQLLEDALRRNAKQAPAQLLLGRTLAGVRDPRRAVRALQAYMDLTKSSGGFGFAAAVQLEIAQLFGEMGQWDDARRAIQQIDLRLPDTKLAGRVLASRLEIEAQAARLRPGGPDMEMLKRVEAAVADLLRQNPESPRVRLLQARVLGWQGRLDEAVAILNSTHPTDEEKLLPTFRLISLYADARKYDEAIRLCEAAIQSASTEDALRLKLHLAGIYGAAGDVPAAQKTLDELATQLTGPERSAVRVQLADILARSGKPAEAQALLAQVAAEDPQNIDARIRLLQGNLAASDPARRQQWVDEIKRIEGAGGLSAQYFQAVVWLDQPDWSNRRRAIEESLRTCIAADPAWEGPILALGLLHEKAQDQEQAMDVYRKFLDLNRGNMTVTLPLLDLAYRMERWQEIEQILAGIPADEPAVQEYRLSLALRQGDEQRARQLLVARAQGNPDDYLSLLRLSELNLRSNNIQDAERQLAEAIKRAPDAPRVLAARVQLHLRKQEHEQALQACNEALKDGPNADALELRSRVHETKGEIDQAVEDLRALAKLDGMMERGLEALGGLYYRQDQWPQAIATWREGLKVAPKSYMLRGALAGMLLSSTDAAQQQEGSQILEQLLQEKPNQLTLHMMRAEHLARQDPVQAERAFAAIIEKFPKSVKAYAYLAEMALAANQTNRALELIDRGLNTDPRNVELLIQRSGVLLMSGSALRARLAAEEAVKLQPNSINTRLAYAYVLIKAHDFRTAEEQIALVSDGAQNEPLIARARMDLFAAQGQWDSVAALAADLLKKDPDNPSPVFWGATLLSRSGQAAAQERGIDLLKQLIELHPKNAAAFMRLGESYLGMGQFGEAKAAYVQGLALEPDNAAFLNNLAWIVCEEMNDPAGALEWAQKALNLSPDDPHTLDTWGVLQYRLGKHDVSREALNKCLGHNELPRATRASATFHLARTLAELDREAGRKLVETLLADADMVRSLSDKNREEATKLRDRLKSGT